MSNNPPLMLLTGATGFIGFRILCHALSHFHPGFMFGRDELLRTGEGMCKTTNYILLGQVVGLEDQVWPGGRSMAVASVQDLMVEVVGQHLELSGVGKK